MSSVEKDPDTAITMQMVNNTIVAYPPKAEWPDKSSVCFNISRLSEDHTAGGDFKKLENRAV